MLSLNTQKIYSFVQVKGIHSYSTDFIPSKFKSNHEMESFFLQLVVNLWERLLKNIKIISSLGGFKCALKNWLRGYL